MREPYVRVMQMLHWACIVWCGAAIACMTVLIFTGVVMRYGFAVGARFAEPMSIFFAVQLTMYGAAACYRADSHLRLSVFVDALPPGLAGAVDRLVQLLLAAFAVAMIYYGFNLAETTWFQSYPEFEHIRVGVVYAAIPISGCIFLLFIIEHWAFGRPEVDITTARPADRAADPEAR